MGRWRIDEKKKMNKREKVYVKTMKYVYFLQFLVIYFQNHDFHIENQQCIQLIVDFMYNERVYFNSNESFWRRYKKKIDCKYLC